MTAARYRLRNRLEAGELAELFKARRDDGADVVIKLFHEKTTDLRYARALANTSRALAELEAPGLLHVTDIGLAHGRLAVVREGANVHSLGDALQRLNTRDVVLPPTLALALVIDLLKTVGQVHEEGVVHGSITPGNVALARNGQVVIYDFGALEALLAVPAFKKSFAPKGRASYRAPELGVGEAASIHSDVYSVGSLLYELLTLKEAVTTKDGAVRTRAEKVVPPSRIDRRLNTRLDAVVMRAIEATPQRRYKSCREFESAIREFLATAGGMPSRADASGFVAELFPKDASQLQNAGAGLPWTEEFRLSEVSGVELPAVERSIVVDARKPYTTGENLMAVPAPKWKPEEGDGITEDSNPPEVGFEPPVPARREIDAPTTDWDAPVASAPVKRPTKSTGGGKVKVKLVEDFSALSPREEEAPDVRALRNAPPTRAGMEAPPAPAPAPVAPKTETNYPMVKDAPGHRPRPMDSKERGAFKALLLRRRKLILTVVTLVALMLVGAIATLQISLRTLPPLKPDQPMQQLPVPEPARAVKSEPVERDTPGNFVASADSGYLTVLSDEPAVVYIDGVKLSRRTPLTRYPVTPGTRKIALESVATKERREFSLLIQKGQLRTVEERFATAKRLERR